MSSHFIITLRILDRFFRLRINRKDEKKYRDAAVTIEKKTNQYRNYFAGEGSKKLLESDYLMMTTIQALSETEALEAENSMFEQKVKALINELDDYLKNMK